MNKLTKAEEQVMQYLWQIEKGFLKDVLELFPEPKPHTNTISTILKILMEKGFVSHKTFGRQHEYFPLVTKENYSGKSIRSLVKNYCTKACSETKYSYICSPISRGRAVGSSSGS